LARAIGDAGASSLDSPVDLFSLSQMFEFAGSREQSVATCQRALTGGLPEEIEARALRQLAMQYKRQRAHALAVEAWLELARRPSALGLEALEELAIHYEHHQRDLKRAMEFTRSALERLRAQPSPAQTERLMRRIERLRRKSARRQDALRLPVG
jgi:hypothetical protein